MSMIPPSNCLFKGLHNPPCWYCECYNHDTDECRLNPSNIGSAANSVTSQSYEDRIREYENERKKLLELSKEELVDLIIHRPKLY